MHLTISQLFVLYNNNNNNHNQICKAPECQKTSKAYLITLKSNWKIKTLSYIIIYKYNFWLYKASAMIKYTLATETDIREAVIRKEAWTELTVFCTGRSEIYGKLFIK